MAHKVKIPRPKVKELRKLYRAIVSTAVALRIEALKVILQWYDQALPYVENKVETDVERARLKEKMIKTRRLGIGSDKEGEQETAFLTCIRLTEQYCKTLHPVSIDTVYVKYELARKRLEEKQQRLEGKFGSFLNVLRALKPTSHGEPLRIVVSDSQSGKKYGHRTNEFLYSREAAKAGQYLLRQKGVLPLVIEEMKSLSRAAGQQKDSQGHFTLNRELQVDSIFQMLQNFVAFCNSDGAPRRLVRFEPNGSAPRPPREKVPGRKMAFGKREMVDGLFVVSSAAGVVYAALKDEKWHEVVDLQKLISVGVSNRIHCVATKVKFAGWHVEVEGNKVRMTKET